MNAAAQGGHTRSTARAAAALALLACTLWFFWPLVFGGQVLFERDVALFWQAQTDAIVRAIGQGSLPWWDPYLSFGEPLMEFPAQVFYPPTWPAVLLPAGAFYSLSVVAHHVFGGAGLLLFLRAQGLSRIACLVGTVLWMASGPLLSVVNMLTLFSGSTWMPWILLAADAARRRLTPAAGVLWGASVAACLLSGAESVLMAGFASGLWFLRGGASWQALRRRALPGALALATALLLAAAQWIPLLALLRQTARADLPEHVRSHWSLHPLGLLQLAFPLLPRGVPVVPSAELRDFAAPLFYSVFLGTLCWALAAAGCASRPREGGHFFAALALLALVLALGRHTPLYDLALSVVPLLRSIRYPVKLTLLASLAVAVLAALGFDAVAKGEARARRWCAGTLVALWLAAAVVAPRSGQLAVLLAAQPGSVMDSLHQQIRILIGLMLGTSLLALAVLVPRAAARLGAAASPLLALLAVVQPALAHVQLNAVGPEAVLHYRPPLLDAIRADGGTRVFSRTRPREGVTQARATAPVPSGLDPSVALAVNFRQMLVPQVTRLFAMPSSYEGDIQGTQSPAVTRLSALAFATEDSPAFVRLLQLGAVSHVVSLEPRVPEGLELLRRDRTLLGDDVYVYRVPSPLPRCYVVDGVRSLEGGRALAALLSADFAPQREVILENAVVRTAGPGPAGSCRLLNFGMARVEAEVTARGDAFVVLVDADWPNWRATVDGIARPIVRANTAFRAVPVAAGTHSVVFSYGARTVGLGVAVSLVGVLVSALVLVADRRRIAREG